MQPKITQWGTVLLFTLMAKPLWNLLPNDKILVGSKLKVFADNKINVTGKLKFVVGNVENIVRKEKMLVTSIFPFPTMFTKGFLQSC